MPRAHEKDISYVSSLVVRIHLLFEIMVTALASFLEMRILLLSLCSKLLAEEIKAIAYMHV